MLILSIRLKPRSELSNMTKTLNLPTVEELTQALINHQNQMAGGAHAVWLCVDFTWWILTQYNSELFGDNFARSTIGKGDSKEALKMLAENLIQRVTHNESVGY